MDALQPIVDYGVIGVLIVLSLWALAVAVERWIFYRRVKPTQFDDIQTMEIALTKRARGDRDRDSQCALYWFAGNSVRDHVDVSYYGYVRHDGCGNHHGRPQLGAQGEFHVAQHSSDCLHRCPSGRICASHSTLKSKSESTMRASSANNAP